MGPKRAKNPISFPGIDFRRVMNSPGNLAKNPPSLAPMLVKKVLRAVLTIVNALPKAAPQYLGTVVKRYVRTATNRFLTTLKIGASAVLAAPTAFVKASR